jgi:glutamate racemase
MSDHAMKPIGIFDSGVGGLTVVRAVVDHLPCENIIYFGDTAHLPYGDKSAETIQSYVVKIVEMLLQKQCKLILIACNSASAAAYELLKHFIGDRALLVNVIDPTVDFVCEHYGNCHIGLIGTKQTVYSNIYSEKISAKNKKITLHALATPVLVPAIEDGFSDHKIIDDLLEEYLSRPVLENIEALILGCTHYPLIKDKIIRFYQNNMSVIDGSDIIALSVKKLLEAHHLSNQQGTGSKHFYVSDFTDSFAANAKMFFGEDICLEDIVVRP